jgi:hypothetical protein
MYCYCFAGDPLKWTQSKPVTRCAGEDVETKFVYKDSTLSYKNYTSVTWIFRSKNNPTANGIYISYYTNKSQEFKVI